MKYFCNPLNIPYKYQFIEDGDKHIVFREAADPSLILFKETYYLFISMSRGFLTSKDLLKWEFHEFSDIIPIYDYAPDVRVIGDYLYFSASKATKNCSFYRTKDPINSTFEKIEGTFPFWDPNLFLNDDERLYFYWGCSNVEPIYGVELDQKSMKPIGEKIQLIEGHEKVNGYERIGNDHSVEMLNGENAPYIEGAWMTKYGERYYLQYSAPGTEYNVYADGVYVADSPLGPFHLAENNPYSYKPGGFIAGAGHGSTLEDIEGNYWHTSTMRISINHNFERRIGLWRAGFDDEGELYCDQRYGDWPMRINQKPWEKPDWMLLSYRKKVTASSGKDTENVTDENIQTWWIANTNNKGEWVQLDLDKGCDVYGIQINFADDKWHVNLPDGEEIHRENPAKSCYLDKNVTPTRWLLEGSMNGIDYFVIEDKTSVKTDLSHDFIELKTGIQAQYIKLTIVDLPYDQPACVSGLRIFGKVEGKLPNQTKNVQMVQESSMDMLVSWSKDDAVGHNILWGSLPDKLYHSYMVFGKNQQRIGALIEAQQLYFRIDAFNEVGITEGVVVKAI